MTFITLRVIDGADRGRVFEDLPTPVTIGREEGNTIQLNDERISRFHVKIQEDAGKIVLTDLESTNGTKINGEDAQLRILRFGDLISMGRSVMLFGSRDQIASRLANLRQADDDDGTQYPDEVSSQAKRDALDFELDMDRAEEINTTMHLADPPDIPERLTPAQAAQLSEIIEYLHLRIRKLIEAARIDDERDEVMLEGAHWQNLVDLQARLSEYLRMIGEPR